MPSRPASRLKRGKRAAATSAGDRVAGEPARRGRPAQLSRQRILECALELLERGPGAVTLSAVARALGCAPMSLYTHVKNRDDLLMGVSDLVLDQIELNIGNDLPWLEAVEHWLFAVRAQLARYPQVVSLIGEERTLPPQWLRLHAMLIRQLQRGGMRGELLANCARWLPRLVIADILLNQPDLPQLGEGALASAVAGLSAEDRAGFDEMLPHLPTRHGGLFEFEVEQALARLVVLADAVS